MSDLEFFDQRTERRLPFDKEQEAYVWRQYTSKWYVRVNNFQLGVPCIKAGAAYIPLKRYGRETNSYIAPDEEFKQFVKKETRDGNAMPFWGYVGHLELWSLANPNQPSLMSPGLFIQAGSIEPEDFEHIVRRLKELAFFRYSPVLAKKAIEAAGEIVSGNDNDPDQILILAGERLIALGRRVTENWGLIRQSAAKETKLVPRIVNPDRVTGSYAARIAQKSSQFPDARRLEVLVPQETHNTAENRFLALVLLDIQTHSILMSDRLRSHASLLDSEWRDSNEPTGTYSGANQDRDTWKEGKKRAKKVSKEFHDLANKIKDAAQTIRPYADNAFLIESRAFPSFPEQPSDRLTRSASHSPIFWAYHDFQNIAGAMFLPMPSGVMQKLTDESIHPAATLYELWVLVELYDMLVSRFGFHPPVGIENDHPLQHVQVVDGELVWNNISGHIFSLQFTPTNHPDRIITIRLYYDTEAKVEKCIPGKRCFGATCRKGLPCYDKIMVDKHWPPLKPDLRLEMKDSGSGHHKQFAVDAKYRTYRGMVNNYAKERQNFGVASVYDLDLLVTAKMKYHDALECTAAFVVHSDADVERTFWGGSKYRVTPHREDDNYHPAHRFGAVFATPSDAVNLEKLLKCFLMYHMGIENICWNCQRKVEAEERIYWPQNSINIVTDYGVERIGADHQGESGQVKGRCYRCDVCKRSWVFTWCNFDRKHRILKLGAHNFHHSSNSRKPTVYDCPECSNSI